MTTCRAKIRGEWRDHPCPRRAVVGEYCRQHSPEAIEARKVAASERWQAQRAAEARQRRERAARDAAPHVCEPCRAQLAQWAERGE